MTILVHTSRGQLEFKPEVGKPKVENLVKKARRLIDEDTESQPPDTPGSAGEEGG